jgi:hypothetical protein
LQETADAIAKSIEVFFPGEFSLTIKSPNQPTVEQRSYTWNKTDASTGQSLDYFEWNTIVGQWTRAHWPNGLPVYERRLWLGTLAQLELYDGGEPGTVSASTGPYWVQDTNFTDRIPIGAGTTPVGTSANTQVGADGAKTEVWSAYVIKCTARIWDRAI